MLLICVFYLQSLGILGSAPAALLILSLFGLLLYLLTRCCDRKPRTAHSITSLKVTLSVVTVMCCAAIGLGKYSFSVFFYYYFWVLLINTSLILLIYYKITCIYHPKCIAIFPHFLFIRWQISILNVHNENKMLTNRQYCVNTNQPYWHS